MGGNWEPIFGSQEEITVATEALSDVGLVAAQQLVDEEHHVSLIESDLADVH